jgi:hypothetical protein
VLNQIGAVDNFSGQWQLPTPNPSCPTRPPPTPA